MDHCTVKYLLLLSAYIHLTSAGSHSLQYFYTAVTPGIDFPEFTIVGLVDGGQFVYYDSNIRKMIPKTVWMEKSVGEDYWNRQTEIAHESQDIFKSSVGTLIQRLNQTKGVHTVQVMYGCELDDDGFEKEYMQYGYDGEDFIVLDLNTLTWTAVNAKAVFTKHKWEWEREAVVQKEYLKNKCTEYLKKYVEYGRSTLERKVPPEVSLFQKDPSSPVVCHATGFYPKAVMISWQKNGEDLWEDVDLRETLPNQDGTFQKRSILTVSPEELYRNQYSCVVQHGGLEKEIRLQAPDRRVQEDVSGGGLVGITVGVVVVVLLLVFVGCVGIVIWKKTQMIKSSFKPVPNCSSSDSGLE